MRRFWKFWYGYINRPSGHPDAWDDKVFNRYYGKGTL